MNRADVIAVFDVDETLIHCKSMFSFLRFALRATRGNAAGERAYASALDQIQTARDRQTREEVNRLFYRMFAGWRHDQLRELGKAWFSSVGGLEICIPETIAQFESHRAKGHTTVFLSGSADFILKPLVDALDPTALLCITLSEQDDGTTDGEIDGVQTIGSGKAEALGSLVAGLGRPQYLVGYGDHESDLPFLEMCNEMYVVLREDATIPAWAASAVRLPYRPR